MTDEGFVWLDDVAPTRRGPTVALAAPDARRDPTTAHHAEAPSSETSTRVAAEPTRAARGWQPPRRLREATSLVDAARRLRRALVEGCLALTDALALRLERALLSG